MNEASFFGNIHLHRLPSFLAFDFNSPTDPCPVGHAAQEPNYCKAPPTTPTTGRAAGIATPRHKSVLAPTTRIHVPARLRLSGQNRPPHVLLKEWAGKLGWCWEKETAKGSAGERSPVFAGYQSGVWSRVGLIESACPDRCDNLQKHQRRPGSIRGAF